MDIKNQFNLVADEYDKNRKKFIPCFEEFYEGATDIITANIPEPKSVLDLGAGTGLLTSIWYRHYPNARYTLIDVADEMLNAARGRFAGTENISYIAADFLAEFPSGGFDTAISALSIHHLEDGDKARLFGKIYGGLPSGGLFVNYDQFCSECPEFNGWFDDYWQGRWRKSDLSEKDIEMALDRKKLDRECSTEQEINMLKSCGFKAADRIYSNYKFAVIAAIK